MAVGPLPRPAPWKATEEAEKRSNALKAAIQAGIGLTVRTPFWSDLHTLDRTSALPRLPAAATWLVVRKDAPRSTEKLAGLIRTAMGPASLPNA